MDATNVSLEPVDAGRTCILRLNRPERRNAWSPAMASELNDALVRLDRDDRVRVIVLTGAGSTFCVGADLTAAEATFADRPGGSDPTSWRTLVAPWSLRKPVVAAINGHAVGVGITYPLMCDLRFVAEDAKLAFAFVRRGVLPELASHAILPRLVGLERAADLLLSGRTFSGREAAEFGLAHRALPAEDVLDAALAWAADVGHHTAPVSVALSKRLLWRSLAASPFETLRAEQAWMPWICNQSDAAEGAAAFVERRAPAFRLSPTRDLPDWP
ncbi:MAG: enoyl-CoA hydratase-related protein [Myxococcota bacterium]